LRNRDPTCGIVIEELWSPFIAGSPSYCLTKKLKLTKAAIKFWNKHYFGNIKSKLDKTLSLLDKIQQAPPSNSNFGRLNLGSYGLLSLILTQDSSILVLLFVVDEILFLFFRPQLGGGSLIVLILVILMSTILRLCLLLLIRFFLNNYWTFLIQSFQSLTIIFFVLFLLKLRFMIRLSVWVRNKLRVLVASQHYSMSNIGTESKAQFCWLLVIFFFYSNQLLREQNHTFITLIPKLLRASAVLALPTY
jgi:hypothetical protein